MIKQIWTHFRNIKLVKFSNDTYGIRKGWLFYRYLKKRGVYSNDFEWGWKSQAYRPGKLSDIAEIYEEIFIDEGTSLIYDRITEDDQE